MEHTKRSKLLLIWEASQVDMEHKTCTVWRCSRGNRSSESGGVSVEQCCAVDDTLGIVSDNGGLDELCKDRSHGEGKADEENGSGRWTHFRSGNSPKM